MLKPLPSIGTYHVILCTKFSRHILASEKRDFLSETLRTLATESKRLEDHIHFILDAPPVIMLSALVGKLKSKSASAVLNKFGSFFFGKYERTIWSDGPRNNKSLHPKTGRG